MPIKVIYNESRSDGLGQLCDWTIPAGVKKVKFEMWGGGGAAASFANACDCCTISSPGGGGGYAAGYFDVEEGEVYSVCAGNAGVAYNSNCCNGGNGGTSSVTGPGIPGIVCAKGGTGGCGSFAFWCYQHCGCNHMYQSGVACGVVPAETQGCLVGTGGAGRTGRIASGQQARISVGGPAAGPNGGEGGYNLSNIGYNQQSTCQQTVNMLGNEPGGWPYHILNGKTPGGGGAGYSSGCCICDPCGFPGAGGQGLVKITY